MESLECGCAGYLWWSHEPNGLTVTGNRASGSQIVLRMQIPSYEVAKSRSNLTGLLEDGRVDIDNTSRDTAGILDV